MAGDRFAGVAGQDAAVAVLRSAEGREPHAWLFVGPTGSGKRAAALALAAGVVGSGTEGDVRQRHLTLALAGEHPDVIIIEPEGRTFRRPEAMAVIAAAHRSPIEADRKVVIAERLGAAEPEALASMLKTIEEPPVSTVFVLLTEEVIPELVTIASRCVRVDFGPVPETAISQVLADDGVGAEAAAAAAGAAGGDLRRARLLAIDENVTTRARAWAQVPHRLDGQGATVAAVVDDLRALIDASLGVVEARHRVELAEVDARAEQYGERGSGRRQLEESHRREVRRARSDELRFGLATIAREYRSEIEGPDPVSAMAAVGAISEATELLLHNPNEELWLWALFLRLPMLAR